MVAIFAGISAFLFLALVAAMHFLKPELKPSLQMISRYAVGKKGWVMQLAFYSFAAGCLLVALAAAPYSRSGVGSYLLILAALATLGLGYYITDSDDIEVKRRSQGSWLHNIFSFIMIPIFPVAVSFVDFELAASGRFANLACELLPTLSILVCLGFAGFFFAFFYSRGRSQKNRPSVPVGYFQRFMVLTYALWIIAISLIVAGIR